MTAEYLRRIDLMRGHLATADEWVRPMAMEAIVRGGVPVEMVEREMDASPAERDKLSELLSCPRVI